MFPSSVGLRARCAAVLLLIAAVATAPAWAQSCYTEADLDAGQAGAVQTAATRYFQAAAAGDYASLRQNSIAAVASNFDSIVNAIGENKPNLAGAQPSVRALYVLDAQQKSAKGEFFCGVVGMQNSVAFFLPNIPSGRYAVVVQDVKGGKVPIMFTEILQQAGNSWQLAGLYMRPAQIAGHDGNWYLTKAREYKTRGQNHNAWFYYLTAWDLLAPVNFMGSPELDKVADEMQPTRPSDLPTAQAPQELQSGGGKQYKLTQVFPTPVGDALD